ncbi:MAG: hypothetical protein OXH81_17380 [Gemmatimonadetes bacterium]|nr:hypothetical protein [Gemmatimonadota bacterium]
MEQVLKTRTIALGVSVAVLRHPTPSVFLALLTVALLALALWPITPASAQAVPAAPAAPTLTSAAGSDSMAVS